MIILDFLI